jgi:hypothetical protein
MVQIKNIKLNKFNEKLLGASIFLNAELVKDYVKNPTDSYLSVEIENTKDGILIKPLERAVRACEDSGLVPEPAAARRAKRGLHLAYTEQV